MCNLRSGLLLWICAIPLTQVKQPAFLHVTLIDKQANTELSGKRRRTLPRGCWIAVGALSIGGVVTGSALEPTTPLAEYGRQSWVMENGLPQNSVHALVQTRDGFLWLGTEAGLVRFDGIAFTVFDHSPELPSGDIRSLLETPDGTLWVGTAGGLARRKDGAITAFGAHAGPPIGTITALKETPEGRLRVETTEEASEYGGAGWSRVSMPAGLPKDQIVFEAKLASGEPASATRSAVAIGRGTRQAL